MVISIDPKKVFNKVQCPVIIKKKFLKKLRTLVTFIAVTKEGSVLPYSPACQRERGWQEAADHIVSTVKKWRKNKK